eukprot:scaffold3667_cov110-Isochrysis_galbana.AAC.1
MTPTLIGPSSQGLQWRHPTVCHARGRPGRGGRLPKAHRVARRLTVAGVEAEVCGTPAIIGLQSRARRPPGELCLPLVSGRP